ncbi:MAG TPA: hypothetical protein VFJ16_26480 [Longimicrobium sp.]|nr:hypothetical protein [Longimicrobium sp.]
MKMLRMTGWEKGLRKIPLTKEVMRYSGKPMAEAKQCVNDLLAGSEVALSFGDEKKMNEFRDAVANLGVRLSPEGDEHD